MLHASIHRTYMYIYSYYSYNTRTTSYMCALSNSIKLQQKQQIDFIYFKLALALYEMLAMP